MRTMIAYLAALPAFVVVDLLWLGVIAKGFYRGALRPVMVDRIRVAPALLFYLVYPAGLTLFAIAPALATGDIARAAALGGAFGFFAYATYDLTNLATLRDWPVRLTILDLAWGTVLSAAAAVAGFAVALGF